MPAPKKKPVKRVKLTLAANGSKYTTDEGVILRNGSVTELPEDEADALLESDRAKLWDGDGEAVEAPLPVVPEHRIP